MALITPDLTGIVDGATPAASAWTTPFNTITNAINGGLDDTNFTASATNIQSISKSVAWTSYTPTWTGSGGNPAIGNGSITGDWYKIGRVVLFRIEIVSGTTTTYGTGTHIFSLPTATITYNTNYPLGSATIIGNSQVYASFTLVWASSTTANLYSPAVAGGVLVSATSPYTWTAATANQKILITGKYQASA